MKLNVLYHAHRAKIIIAALLLIGGGVYVYRLRSSTTAPTRYVLAAAETGTLIVSVSGNGQVAATNLVALQPRASGEIIRVAVQKGQQVQVGQTLVQIDTTNALKTIRDAETSLETAKLALDKLKAPADPLNIIQSENSLAQAKEAKVDAEQALARAYETGFETASSAFLNLPGLMGGFDSLLFDKTLDRAQWNIDWYASTSYQWQPSIRDEKQTVIDAYEHARALYDPAFQYFKSVSRTSPPEVIERMVNDSYQATLAIADAIKKTGNFIDSIQDLMEQHNFTVPSLMTTQQNSMNSYTGTVNGHVTALANARNSLTDARQGITNAERTIIERQAALDDLRAGPDALDLRSQELTLQQRVDALQDAREALADYSIRAPFAGVVTDVGAQLGQNASSGTAAVTLATAQQLAEITLNEVDTTSVAIGQKATLTFDAIEDLSISGQVATVDEVGTVAQGVVNYKVTIAFDTQDKRVKPGMSVATSIATKVLTDVLMVPNAAVKTNGGSSYVEVLPGATVNDSSSTTGVTASQPPERQMIETGAASDSMTQIISGLTEGDAVVVRTVTAAASSTNQSTNSIIPLPGARSSGSNVRSNIPR